MQPSRCALTYLRAAVRAGVAREHGPTAFAILTVVAMVEAGVRYSRPVTFSNHQLAIDSGCGSADTLDRHRRALITAGWLCYLPGDRRRLGVYRTAVPETLRG
jgi:hypothetical protein